MKVLVNGAQHFGVGWLVGEAYTLKWVGVGDDRNMATIQPGMWPKPRRSTICSNASHPEFYARNEQGIPTAWVARMRESMARLTTQFSANRAVREYTEGHYIRLLQPTVSALLIKVQ